MLNVKSMLMLNAEWLNRVGKAHLYLIIISIIIVSSGSFFFLLYG